MSFTAKEIMLRFRREVDDRLSDPDDLTDDSDRLWENAEIYQYMHEAQYATARKTRGLLRIFSVPTIVGQPYVSVVGAIQVLSAVLTTSWQVLTERNSGEVMGTSSDYGSVSSYNPGSTGTPAYFSLDALAERLRLTPIPVVAEPLEITMIALPRNEITDGADPCAFTDPKDLRILLHYMKYLAYDKQDTDVFDKSTSEDFKAKFEADGAQRELELERLRRRPATVRYAG